MTFADAILLVYRDFIIGLLVVVVSESDAKTVDLLIKKNGYSFSRQSTRNPTGASVQRHFLQLEVLSVSPMHVIFVYVHVYY